MQTCRLNVERCAAVGSPGKPSDDPNASQWLLGSEQSGSEKIFDILGVDPDLAVAVSYDTDRGLANDPRELTL